MTTRQSSPQSWTIGSAADCDIVVDERTVSGRHCRLSASEGGFVVEDLQSRNGTYVNGRRIEGPTAVRACDTITLGQRTPMPWPITAGLAGTAGPVEQTGPAAATAEPEATWGDGSGGPIIRIGRLPDNDIVLDYPVVSGRHARIVFSAGQAWLEDLQSRNGTAIGAAEKKIQRARLDVGDVVFFGTLRVAAERLLAGGLTLGTEAFTAVRLDQQTTLLGRDRNCDIVLDDPRVSRRHARLVRSADDVSIRDLGSSNGTLVNGERISGARILRPGDTVAIGRFAFKLSPEGNLQQRDYRGNVSIEVRDLAVDVPGRRLLEGVSLTIYPSELVGLMGPSGAGKTTLMNAMNGYTPPSAGQVLFNGRDLYSHYAEFQGMMGYVPQDDIMHRDLTVGRALYYTARLRLPSDFGDLEIGQRISAVIGQLGLEGAEKVLIGSPEKKGISGGQRKRVNLAMELLTDPDVLFLDEPTSGLSSEDALMVVRLLRKLADGGKTIVVTIHQPSLDAFRLFDHLILVSKDPRSAEPGRLAYFGPAYPDAVRFFNPEGVVGLRRGQEPLPDEILRGLAKDKTAAWAARYADSEEKRRFVDERRGKQPVEPRQRGRRRRGLGVGQWFTLVRRVVAVKLRDTANTLILLAQAPIIALLVVLVFGKQAAETVSTENWPVVANATAITVFLLALAALWFGCSNSAREIVGEWSIYHRERMVNLKIRSYVASKFAVLGGLCVVQCAILLGIVYAGTALQGPWPSMFGMLLLVSLVGLGVGLTVSAVARTSEVAIALLPLILLPMVILGGVLQPVHKLNRPMKWLSTAMPSRWAFEGLLVLEAAERPLGFATPPPVPPMPKLPLTGPALTGPASGLPEVGSLAAPPVAMPAPPEPTDDMADRYFPKGEERSGTPAAASVLGAMLAALVVAVNLILRGRDVHRRWKR